jgi:hypothetical protein
MTPAQSPPPYRRLPDRKKARGQLVSFVLPRAQLRRAQRTAKRLRWSTSELYRTAIAEWLAHAPTSHRTGEPA